MTLRRAPTSSSEGHWCASSSSARSSREARLTHAFAPQLSTWGRGLASVLQRCAYCDKRCCLLTCGHKNEPVAGRIECHACLSGPPLADELIDHRTQWRTRVATDSNISLNVNDVGATVRKFYDQVINTVLKLNTALSCVVARKRWNSRLEIAQRSESRGESPLAASGYQRIRRGPSSAPMVIESTIPRVYQVRMKSALDSGQCRQ